MKTEIKKIIIDIDIIIEAINNEDLKDAVSMLKELKQDLKVIELIS
jgi:predicted nucleotidyltransferase